MIAPECDDVTSGAVEMRKVAVGALQAIELKAKQLRRLIHTLDQVIQDGPRAVYGEDGKSESWADTLKRVDDSEVQSGEVDGKDIAA